MGERCSTSLSWTAPPQCPQTPSSSCWGPLDLNQGALLPGDSCQGQETSFVCYNVGLGWGGFYRHLVDKRPGMLLNILQCTGWPHNQERPGPK